MSNLRNVYDQINLKKLKKKKQIRELIDMKQQIAFLNHLIEKQTLISSTIEKRFFIDIKICDKNFELYYDHDHFKYDNYVYEMKKIFKNNEDFENVKNFEKHKVILFIS